MRGITDFCGVFFPHTNAFNIWFKPFFMVLIFAVMYFVAANISI